ncbi:MAG: hypothetical protein JO366_00535 [Methylobacteriaceae bacterium]|nr:hypothetical protein [Methylobacteriaceae bacterium]MBV9243279.1 hypothetical protein [Methylobacteriaceae bacterium]
MMESEARFEIEELVEKLTPEDRKLLRDMSESELIQLHMGYGMWLRNQFRRGELPHLFKSCSARIRSEDRGFDAISTVAIREIWLHVRATR